MGTISSTKPCHNEQHDLHLRVWCFCGARPFRSMREDWLLVHLRSASLRQLAASHSAPDSHVRAIIVAHDYEYWPNAQSLQPEYEPDRSHPTRRDSIYADICAELYWESGFRGSRLRVARRRDSRCLVCAVCCTEGISAHIAAAETARPRNQEPALHALRRDDRWTRDDTCVRMASEIRGARHATPRLVAESFLPLVLCATLAELCAVY